MWPPCSTSWPLVGHQGVPDDIGRPPTPRAWASGSGAIDAAGVEGIGAWGARVARHLRAAGYRVVEVDRPDRKAPPPSRHVRHDRRRSRGPGRPVRHRLRRTQSPHHCLVSTAPDELRDQHSATTGSTSSSPPPLGPGPTTRPARSGPPKRAALDRLPLPAPERRDHRARRHPRTARRRDHTEPGRAQRCRHRCRRPTPRHRRRRTRPALLRRRVRPSVRRCPHPRIIGRTQGHRLNRGGDRAANAAIYRMVLPAPLGPPHSHLRRRTQQSRPHQTRDHPLPHAHIAREIHHELTRPTLHLP